MINFLSARQGISRRESLYSNSLPDNLSVFSSFLHGETPVSPTPFPVRSFSARQGSNLRPRPYKDLALPLSYEPCVFLITFTSKVVFSASWNYDNQHPLSKSRTVSSVVPRTKAKLGTGQGARSLLPIFLTSETSLENRHAFGRSLEGMTIPLKVGA